MTTKLPTKSSKIPMSKSVEGLGLPASFRLHPDVGTSSDLKQPGGFRRAHVLKARRSSTDAAAAAYAQTPLVSHMESTGSRGFVTFALHELKDGTLIRYESRHYRRGRAPEIVRLPTGEAPAKVPLRFCGFKPSSVPYWVSMSFLIEEFSTCVRM